MIQQNKPQAAQSNGWRISYIVSGLAQSSATVRLIWAHGWGQSHTVFLPLAESLDTQAHHVLLDFPGFGESPLPPRAWGTQDYAQAVFEFLQRLPFKGKNIWVGHSFGCRIGLRLAGLYPDLLQGLFLISGAGLPRKHGWPSHIRLGCKIASFKTLKYIWKLFGGDVDILRRHFGSHDYQSAGPLRATFLKVVQEDLSTIAGSVKCPVYLLYGENDHETPPEIGYRLQKLISHAHMVALRDHDHYSLLSTGRHQVMKHLQIFLRGL